MNQKSIEHIALYSLVLVGTLVVGVLARQFVLSKGIDDFSSSVVFFATVIVLMAIYASLQIRLHLQGLPVHECHTGLHRGSDLSPAGSLLR